MPASIVFEHPTIRQLATAVQGLIHPSETEGERRSARVAQIEAMVVKYTSNLPSPSNGANRQLVGPPVVLLTGSTGNIGSHILASLLSDDRVGKIYTLDRASSSSSQRLKAAFAVRGLPLVLLEDKRLVPLTGTLTQDSFGLDDSVYNEVRIPPSFHPCLAAICYSHMFSIAISLRHTYYP